MSLSIATSNLVKSSASKPENVNTGQYRAVSEQDDSGEQKRFSDTLDATLGETKNSKVVKGGESETAVTEADTIDGESELKGQAGTQSVLIADSDEVAANSEDLGVKKMSPEGKKALAEDGIADLEQHSSHKVNKEGEKQQPQMPLVEPGKQGADKTVSESAQLLARLDESNRALKTPLIGQSNELKVTVMKPNTAQVASSENTVEQSVIKLTPVVGKTQAQTVSSESLLSQPNGDSVEADISNNLDTGVQQTADVSKISAHLSDTEANSQSSAVNVAQVTLVTDDVIGHETEVALSKQGVSQYEMPQQRATGLTGVVEMPVEDSQQVTDKQTLEVAAKHDNNTIQWQKQSELDMVQELSEQQNQHLLTIQAQQKESETLATERAQPQANALHPAKVTDDMVTDDMVAGDGDIVTDDIVTGEKAAATATATIANLDTSGTTVLSSMDNEAATDSEQLMSVQLGSAIKPSSELQWSTSETKVELTDNHNTKAVKPAFNAAGATTALNNALATTNSTSAISSADNITAANVALSSTSVEGKLINHSAQLADSSASASTAASSNLAQFASVATSAAAMGANSRKQAGNEVSDINAATGTTSSATQLNMVRAEQAQQAATPQSPLLLNKENAAEQMSERLQMMMSKNLKHVDIRLDPPELGRMQIRMTLNSDSASVHFTVQNQQTRDMVDQAMPRLREMLAQQGITLADTSVQQQNSGQQRDAQQMAQGAGQGSGSRNTGQEDVGVMADETSTVNVALKKPSDGISYYA